MTLNLWESSLLNKTINKVTSKRRRRDLIGSHSWGCGSHFTAPGWFQCKCNWASIIRCTNRPSLTVSGLRGWGVELWWWFPTWYGSPTFCPFPLFLFSVTWENTGEGFAYGRKTNQNRFCFPQSPTHKSVPRGEQGPWGLATEGSGKAARFLGHIPEELFSIMIQFGI